MVPDGITKYMTQGVDSVNQRSMDIFWLGTDLDKSYNIKEKWGIQHSPTFMLHDLTNSRVRLCAIDNLPPPPPPPPPIYLPLICLVDALSEQPPTWCFSRPSRSLSP